LSNFVEFLSTPKKHRQVKKFSCIKHMFDNNIFNTTIYVHNSPFLKIFFVFTQFFVSLLPCFLSQLLPYFQIYLLSFFPTSSQFFCPSFYSNFSIPIFLFQFFYFNFSISIFQQKNEPPILVTHFKNLILCFFNSSLSGKLTVRFAYHFNTIGNSNFV
jgi:hypothetical protein